MKPDSRTRIVYIRDEKRVPHAVIMYNVSSSKEPGKTKVSAGASFCARSDVFKREFGMQIAGGRLRESALVCELDETMSPFQVERYIMNRITEPEYDDDPAWAHMTPRYIKKLVRNFNK